MAENTKRNARAELRKAQTTFALADASRDEASLGAAQSGFSTRMDLSDAFF